MSKVMNDLMEHFAHFTYLQKENMKQAKEINELKRRLEIYNKCRPDVKAIINSSKWIEVLDFIEFRDSQYEDEETVREIIDYFKSMEREK